MKPSCCNLETSNLFPYNNLVFPINKLLRPFHHQAPSSVNAQPHNTQSPQRQNQCLPPEAQLPRTMKWRRVPDHPADQLSIQVKPNRHEWGLGAVGSSLNWSYHHPKPTSQKLNFHEEKGTSTIILIWGLGTVGSYEWTIVYNHLNHEWGLGAVGSALVS